MATKKDYYEVLGVNKNATDEELKKEVKNVVMLHYAGKPGKPWRRKFVPKDYQEFINKIPKSLRRYTFRDFRKKLFSKV